MRDTAAVGAVLGSLLELDPLPASQPADTMPVVNDPSTGEDYFVDAEPNDVVP